jgi:hypothetical protein
MRHESHGRRTTDVAVCVASLRREAYGHSASAFLFINEHVKMWFSVFLITTLSLKIGEWLASHCGCSIPRVDSAR